MEVFPEFQIARKKIIAIFALLIVRTREPQYVYQVEVKRHKYE